MYYQIRQSDQVKCLKILTFIVILFFLAGCGRKPGRTTTNRSDSNASAKIQNTQRQLKDTSILFLWREKRYDDDYKDSVFVLMINTPFCKDITDAEKAAVGFVATFVGNDCEWEGNQKNDQGNLKCRILSALNLGYQCSEKHLGFLRKWFKNDQNSLKKLENCPKIPHNGIRKNNFNEIRLTVRGDSIIVFDSGNGADLNTFDNWRWNEEYIFLLSHDELKVINYRKWL